MTNDAKNNRKKAGAILSAVFIFIYIILEVAAMVWLFMIDGLPTAFMLIIACVMFAITFGIIYVLRERLKEIEGGEEDEASKY